jgi:hypothetical protein
MTGRKAGHQAVICLPSNNLDMSTSIIVDTLKFQTMVLSDALVHQLHLLPS